MSNTINVNGMTSYYSSFIKSVTAKTSVNNGSKINSGTVNGEKDSFISTLSSKVETAGTLEETAAVSTKDMTLEEYKHFINDTISKYNIHSSHSCDSYAISISDEGFKAMQADPEYEKWVMDSIKGMLGKEYSSGNRALTGPLCCVCSFGASKAECRCLSWSNGYQNGNGEKVWEYEVSEGVWAGGAEFHDGDVKDADYTVYEMFTYTPARIDMIFEDGRWVINNFYDMKYMVDVRNSMLQYLVTDMM